MIRPMKVAGAFYPADSVELKEMFDYFFSNVANFKIDNLKAIVSPHAGYIYSGQLAAYSYYALAQNLDKIPKTIFVMSPDHYIWMNKVLVGNYEEVETPFGNLKVNQDIVNELLTNYPEYFTDEYLMYDQEHAQETQYPFLKYILADKSDEFSIVPLIFWQVDVVQIANVLQNYVWKAFFVVSSDLSHYLPYEEAILKDEKSLDILINKKLDLINEADACGIFPWACLDILALQNNWEWKLLKYMNSWDTAGDKSKVVGYGAVAYVWG